MFAQISPTYQIMPTIREESRSLDKNNNSADKEFKSNLSTETKDSDNKLSKQNSSTEDNRTTLKNGVTTTKSRYGSERKSDYEKTSDDSFKLPGNEHTDDDVFINPSVKSNSPKTNRNNVKFQQLRRAQSVTFHNRGESSETASKSQSTGDFVQVQQRSRWRNISIR